MNSARACFLLLFLISSCGLVAMDEGQFIDEFVEGFIDGQLCHIRSIGNEKNGEDVLNKLKMLSHLSGQIYMISQLCRLTREQLVEMKEFTQCINFLRKKLENDISTNFTQNSEIYFSREESNILLQQIIWKQRIEITQQHMPIDELVKCLTK